MRIIAAADTHMYHHLLRLPPGDVFIHAGDLCKRGSLDELGRAAEWLRRLQYPTKIVVAGNHDWAFAREPEAARALLGPEIVYLEDAGAEVAGARVWGSPWQPEFMGWAFNLPRGPALAARWAQIPEGLDLLVTHGPPRGFGDRPNPSENAGDADLAVRVAEVRPALHIFGHIHEDGGLWTERGVTYVNVTTSYSARGPTVLDYDPASRTVTPIEVP